MILIPASKKIYIIAELFCGHIHGSFIDCLDTYYNLKELGLDCELIILVHLQHINTWKSKLNQLYYPILVRDILKHINTKIPNINKDDIIICKYESLKNNTIDYHNYNNIYIINDLILTGDYIKGTNVINIDNIDSIKGVLSTNFLKQFLHKVIINYIPFSKFRLDNMKVSYKLGEFSDYDNYHMLKQQDYFNVHQYQSLKYSRHYLGGVEIKGKLIFEFRYFNKPVKYLSIKKFMNDGLTDYLALFGINDNIDQDITISKDEISKSLCGMTHLSLI